MTVVHQGIPGGSLDDDGIKKFGTAARVGARFERQVAAAFDRWLAPLAETVHLFHDLRGIRVPSSRTGQQIDLGAGNIDHVLLTGGRWANG
jgi:hypothetical protein